MGQTILRWVVGWLIGLFIGFSIVFAAKYEAVREILLFDIMAVVAFILIMRRMRGG